MGKKPAARQPSPMWVTTADLPTSAGHPFFERLNRVLEEAGFDAFVEGLCAVFYASRLGRPSLRPGRYFRLLFIGYFEGLSSERGIAWRVADSLSLRAFLDLDVTEAPPNHSTLSRTRRLIDVETHVAVFTWVLERLAGAGLVQGKTVGVDATTLEANAAMRSIERRDTGESYEAFVRQLAKASGIETPTRAELARFDRSRKDRKTSNKEWQSPQDPDAKIAKMKDGRTHLAHKAEHGIDLETGAILSVTVQDASEGDSATLPETLTMAAEQVEAVQPAGAEVEEVVADKGVPQRRDAGGSRRDWGSQLRLGAGAGSALLAGQEDGRDAGGEAYCTEGTIWEPSAYSRRPRPSSSTPPRGAGGAAFRAPVRDRGAAASVGARPRECAQAGAHPGGRLQPRTAAAPADRRRHAPEPAGAGSFGHLRTDRSPDRALGASDGLLGLPMDAGGAGRLNRSSPSCLNRPAQRTAFFHGLVGPSRSGFDLGVGGGDVPDAVELR